MPKFCPECGQPIPQQVKFCPECGTNIVSLKLNAARSPSDQEKKESRKFVCDPDNFSTDNVTSSMGLQIFQGVVGNVSKNSSTSGSVSTSMNGNVSGYVRTDHWTTFRVDNRPCWFGYNADLTDGDIVVVAGEGSGTFYVWAYYNYNTNRKYWQAAKSYNQNIYPVYILMGLAAIIGFPVTVLLMLDMNFVGGLAVLGVALYFLWELDKLATQMKKRDDALKMIRNSVK